MDDLLKVILIILGGISIIGLCLFAIPFISFWVAYFCGWCTKCVIGAKLAAGLNMIFNTTYFTANMIPMIAGTLAWIGGFFKGSQIAYQTADKITKKKKFN